MNTAGPREHPEGPPPAGQLHDHLVGTNGGGLPNTVTDWRRRRTATWSRERASEVVRVLELGGSLRGLGPVVVPRQRVAPCGGHQLWWAAVSGAPVNGVPLGFTGPVASQVEGMPSPPSVVVFDVNETLSDLRPIGGRFTDIGLPAHLAPTWFTGVLRDGFALAATGRQAGFASIAEGVLRTLFTTQALNREPEAAVQHVLQGLTALQVHPDVPDGVRALAATGRRLVTLTNGSTGVADALLTSAGVREQFERLLSVDDAGIWKPAAASYAYAAEQCNVPLRQMLLVAVHPWDIHGAASAGMQTAWVNRVGSPYPPYFTPPTCTLTGIDTLAGQLADINSTDG